MGLIAAQTVNIANINTLEYAEVRIFIISCMIGICWLYSVTKCIKNNRVYKILYVLGGSIGAVIGAQSNNIINYLT